MTASITTAEEKSRLRRELRARLTAIPERERRGEDDLLFAAFLQLSALDAAQTVFLFYGVGTEPETGRMIPSLLRMGKTVALPRLLPGHGMQARLFCPNRPLVQHPYGLWEPDEGCPIIPREHIDLALVPAVCYDKSGFRLGLGGGYYDRWLSGYTGTTVGLCRTALLQESLPVQAHDRPVDLVITPLEFFSKK